jgi:thiamine monophosphate synthase
MRIDSVCNIHSGYTARGKLEALLEGGVPAIQLRDISNDGGAMVGSLSRYDLIGISEQIGGQTHDRIK